jgi:dTDP-4-amino-4,6-dideoxygalactose transaminase
MSSPTTSSARLASEPPPLTIPFNRYTPMGRELDYIRETMGIGQIAGGQTFSQRSQRWFEQNLGVARALLTTSCTHALEMSALLLALDADDEVIVPAYTFVSTASAFALRGARIVFADVRPDTFNLDESLLPGLITDRTKAIVPVHYAGVGCEMTPLLELAKRKGIAVVEDNAHGLFGKYRGRWLGTLGHLAAQSFHETKNITCGEGGALLINDESYRERAEIIRDKGTNRARFFRGQVDKYTWVDLGSSYVMSDVLAAFLHAQLEFWDTIQEKRRAIWARYNLELAAWGQAMGVRLPVVPAHCDPAWHMFYLVMPNLTMRTAFIDHLRARGILAVFHYQPLHLSDYGRRYGGRPGQCPVAESAGDCLVRLPFFNGLTADEQSQVIEAALSFGR